MIPLSNSIGNQLRRIRLEQQLTQKEVCQNICSQAELSKIEQGKVSATIETIQKIANRLNVSMLQLFEEDAQAVLFQEYDQGWTQLFRNQKFDAVINSVKETLSTPININVYLLAKYFELIALEGKKRLDYRSCISELSFLADQEEVWYESPLMYIRIKLAIANYYYLNHQFVHSRKIYEALLVMDYNTEELKNLRIKILYNHAQQLFFQEDYREGMKVTEIGISESIERKNSSFLGHFFYQRANFKEKLEFDEIKKIKEDYTLSYTLFTAFNLERYVEIVEKGRNDYLLFKFL
ncbi:MULTISPECIES: helix-turn-helix domain-containing protein [unclassified Exiguobacterium]|uniref:helix-turn-helix domain-containing protein n=1 Tax=unclassified Exiguobacterium TaxID=2644629 RepID=UPI000DF82A76|nr:MULTISPECIES: helix-turn-helix domain-containing protein [unclassified Exiguobacterium]RDB33927.1 XRE family transcriptional regulator [Exiguobacterium sp. RIT594]